MARFDLTYPLKSSPSLSDRVWGLDVTPEINRGFTLQSILEAGGLLITRVLNSELSITSPTAGTITASWINHQGITRSVTDQALTFAGAPAASNFRFDNVLGNDDGTVTVQTGTPATTNPVIPTVPSTALLLATILWNDAGSSESSGPTTTSPFPQNRFTTKLEPGTNGKYAKIWEGTRTREQNYQIHLSYGSPSSSQDWSTANKGKSGILILNFLCDNAREILPNNVQFFTVDSNSEVEDFVLVELPANKVGLFHKSTDFWMRMQYRVIFNNSPVQISQFIDNAAYTTLPAGEHWDSVPFPAVIPNDSITNAKLANVDTATIKGRITADPGDPEDLTPAQVRTLLNVEDGAKAYPEAVLRENNTVLFDKDYIIGNSGARTGNVLFDFTGAKLGASTVMKHNDASAFTFPTENIIVSGTYEASVDNYLCFLLIDKTASSEVVLCTISKEVV